MLRILFDARVLHLIKRGYLAPQAGGERYDLWTVDYGAYVDLVGTESEPNRILPLELLAGEIDPRSIALELEEYTQLPPLLDSSPTLDELLPALHVNEELGLQAVWEGRGALQAPVALVDRPYHQRREVLWLDLSGAAGHVAIWAAPARPGHAIHPPPRLADDPDGLPRPRVAPGHRGSEGTDVVAPTLRTWALWKTGAWLWIGRVPGVSCCG